jgi:hypothetical protein
VLASFARVRRAVRRSPLEASLALLALGVTAYVLVAPLLVSRYLPMTDLPFHAASGAIFRHYWDPAYHLREQFALHPFASPYVSSYAVVAASMLVFSMPVAVKISVAAMLVLVPAGLAVLFHGAGKSPLLGLLGLGLCWGNLTHWGFLNYVAALGLFAMVVGFTLLVVRRPTRRRQLGLFLALVALFFTHVYRFPFALAAVAGTALVMYPATRRLWPVLSPLLPAVLLFAVWWVLRPSALGGEIALGFHPGRLVHELGDDLTRGFVDRGVMDALLLQIDVAWAVAFVCAAHAAGRWARGFRRFTARDAGVTLAPLGCAAVFLVLFVIMPEWIGAWWYVYPREATAAAVILCGACPDLPRAAWLRVPLVAALSLAAIGVGRQVASHYAEFAAPGEDFYRITRALPQAPRLFYLIFDHEGTTRSATPFIHLPAYVQAEKGGWLSWHFALWGQSPVVYRDRGEPGAVLPPPTPVRWEWTPERFDLRMARFFDWFLVRQQTSPDGLFARDPTIQRVDHVGTWWLYRRAHAR